jgi:hypothetical protein
MPSWRVYYADGSTYDGAVADAPGDGVIVIVQADNTPGDPYAVGRELLFDADFYCYRVREDRWFRCDVFGLHDYLRTPGHMSKVVFGQWAARSVYKATLIRAQQDPDFPVKSAMQAGERRLVMS